MTKPKILHTLSGRIEARPPIWLMRQAGRYLPEYRAIREKAGSFLDLCFNPDLAAEVTLQPLRRFDLDAAIIFSDILVIPHVLGQPLSFVEGEGPRLDPVTQSKNLSLDIQKLLPVYAAIKAVRRAMPVEKALIGFAGAPWTVACYMIQGYGDGRFSKALNFMRTNPSEFEKIIAAVEKATLEHLLSQIEAGADLLQVFDSWAGLLRAEEFERYVIRPTARILKNLREKHPDTPVIGFPRNGEIYAESYITGTGVRALGIGHGTSLHEIRRKCGASICLQGNLAPEVLLAGGEELRKATQDIINAMEGTPFIFNLGHGVIKETPPEHVAELVAYVKEGKRV